jgi:hypothetical protein
MIAFGNLTRAPPLPTSSLRQTRLQRRPTVARHCMQIIYVCVVMGGGRSFAFTLIPRTGVQGHTYSLHRTHWGASLGL